MKLTPATKMTELTTERREAYAREIMGYESVMDAILTAATKGKGYIHIPQTLAASLRSTKAATQLVTALKKSGYNVEWVTTTLPEKRQTKETGAFIQYEELRITWAQTRIHSGPQTETA